VGAENREHPVLRIERPHPSLWTYYLLNALIILPAAPVLLPSFWFRYQSMRYRFTEEGGSMSWGILWRRQTVLNYARIRDIHLQSNLLERWLGLARIKVRTASGNASAEMTIEGLKEFEAVRDFPYSRMRGIRETTPSPALGARPTNGPAQPEELAAGCGWAASRHPVHFGPRFCPRWKRPFSRP
jgi:putative membrane protein